MILLLQATVLELTTLRSNYRYQSHNTDVLQKTKTTISLTTHEKQWFRASVCFNVILIMCIHRK